MDDPREHCIVCHLQSLSSWKRVVNPENTPIKDFSVQYRAKLKRLAELEHTAKVTMCLITIYCSRSKAETSSVSAPNIKTWRNLQGNMDGF